MSRGEGGDAGFTLVELLVAMGLLALASVLVMQGFAVDRASLRRVQARTEAVDTVAAAQDLLRDRVEHLFPAVRFDSDGPKVRFAGAPDRVEFMVAGGRQAADGRPVGRLRLDRSPNSELELEELSSEEDPTVVERRSVLLQGVRTLEVDYYGAPRPGAAPGWRSDWVDAAAAPELVRVRVGFAGADRRAWPELIMRPAAEVDTACILDPATLACRGRA